MVKSEGPLSLFKGLSASIMSVSNAIIYFTIYEKLKEVAIERVHNFNSFPVLVVSISAKSK